MPGPQSRSSRGREAYTGRRALAEIGEGSGQEEGGSRASRPAYRKPRTARLQFWTQVAIACITACVRLKKGDQYVRKIVSCVVEICVEFVGKLRFTISSWVLGGCALRKGSGSGTTALPALALEPQGFIDAENCLLCSPRHPAGGQSATTTMTTRKRRTPQPRAGGQRPSSLGRHAGASAASSRRRSAPAPPATSPYLPGGT